MTTRIPSDRPAGEAPVTPAGPVTSPVIPGWHSDVATPGLPVSGPPKAGRPGTSSSAPSAVPPAAEGAGQTPAGGADGKPRPPAGFHPLAAAMSEDRGPDSLDAHVRRLMKDLGLWGFHPFDSRRSKEGWPDWTILGSRVLYRELKAEKGKVTVAQQAVGDMLTAAGDDWAVWRPSDLFSQRIARELVAISRLGRAA